MQVFKYIFLIIIAVLCSFLKLIFLCHLSANISESSFIDINTLPFYIRNASVRNIFDLSPFMQRNKIKIIVPHIYIKCDKDINYAIVKSINAQYQR